MVNLFDDESYMKDMRNMIQSVMFVFGLKKFGS